MPRYQVIAKGFADGKVYKPGGKRCILTTAKPFKSKDKKEQVPSWLKRIKDETAKEKAAREKVEVDVAIAASEKKDNDLEDISKASFLGDGEKAGAVETL